MKSNKNELDQNSLIQISKSHKSKINTPFGYFGSKNKIAFQICRELPPHNCWIEAFCGSAAITLVKAPAPIEIINDIDNQIVNFFEQLRTNEKELCRVVSLTPYSRQELSLARSAKNSDSNVEKARRFLVQSMMAINGVFGEERGGFSYSQSYSRHNKEARVNRWYNLPERLTEVAERLRSVRVENLDARKLLQMFSNRPATLIYLDPPYFVDRTNGYDRDENSEEFHRELLEIANESSCMMLISGYESELYNSMLKSTKGWSRRSIETHTKDSKGRIHKRTEVLWMNKSFVKARKKGELPITLTELEKKQGKVNPVR